MTMATTTPMITAVSAGVGGPVGGAGERHTHGTRLSTTCNAISNHTHISYIRTYVHHNT